MTPSREMNSGRSSVRLPGKTQCTPSFYYENIVPGPDRRKKSMRDLFFGWQRSSVLSKWSARILDSACLSGWLIRSRRPRRGKYVSPISYQPFHQSGAFSNSSATYPVAAQCPSPIPATNNFASAFGIQVSRFSVGVRKFFTSRSISLIKRSIFHCNRRQASSQ